MNLNVSDVFQSLIWVTGVVLVVSSIAWSISYYNVEALKQTPDQINAWTMRNCVNDPNLRSSVFCQSLTPKGK